MRILKRLQILALLPLTLAVGCKDDDPAVLAPVVVSTNPAEDDVDVATNSTVEITFNKEMNAATINNVTFSIKDGTDNKVGTVAYLDKTATFTPIDNFKSSTLYTVTLKSVVEGVDGMSLDSDYTFNFTTGILVDVVVPTVVSTNPINDATNVARNKVIEITFSEKMSAATFTATSFVVAQGANAVEGSITYSDNTASFIPNTILDASLTYTATVNTSVKDLAGNSLAVTKAWTFTTGAEAGQSVVNLRAAGNYVILAKTAINNAPTSAITGDLGLSPAATTFITGFALTDATGYATSPQITGKVYAADMAPPTNTNLTTAVENMITAYNEAAGRTTPDFSELGAGNIGGEILLAGLYKWTNIVTMPSDVIIRGGADDVWIFQIAGDVTMSSAVKITLEGGAKARNIFWQVAGEVVMGTTSHFEGNILSMTGITLQTGATMNGRALAQTAVILDANTVTKVQ